MQTGQKHIHAQEAEQRNYKTDGRPPGHRRAAPTFGETHVQPGRVVEQHDLGPGFFRIPRPITTPRFGCPQGAQYGCDGEEGKAQGNDFVHHVIQNF